MKKQGFIYGSVILAASAVITKIIGAFFRIPMASMLGGTGMGYFSCAYGIFMPVYAVTAAGLPAAAARLTARSAALDGGASFKRIRRTALILFTGAGLAGMLLIMAAAPFFCENISHNTAALPSVAIIAPAVLFGCPCAVLRGFYEGRMNMYPTALSQVAEALVKLAAGLGGAYLVLNKFINMPIFDADPTGRLRLSYASAAACGGITLSVFAGLVYMVIYDCFAYCREQTVSDISNKKIMTVKETARELTAVAVPAAVCALAANITSVIDLVSIMRALEKAVREQPQAFAEYAMPLSEIPNFIYGSFSGLAVTVFNLVPSVTNMFGKGILPKASECSGKGDKCALGKCAENVLTAAAAVAIPGAFGIAALSREILDVLFSGSPAEAAVAAGPLAAMMPGLVFLCLSSALFPVFQGADRPDIPVKLTAVGAAVKALGNFLLVPVMGITGAAVSTDICYGVILIGALVMMKKTVGTSQKKAAGCILKLTFAGAMCGGAAFLTSQILSPYFGKVSALAFSVLSGAVIYIIITYFEGLTGKNTLKMLISKKI